MADINHDPIASMTPSSPAPLLAAVVLSALAACAPVGSAPEPAPPSAEYAALPDTLVCVVDRNSPRGLRHLEAKRAPDGRVLLRVDGEVQPLERVHPVNLIAGYAGREPWYRSGEPIIVGGHRFVRVPGERRIPLDRLHQYSEFNGIPVFVDPADEPPPEAVYVPTEPGCIFGAYVREELMGDG